MALSLPRFSNDPESPYRPRKFLATWELIAAQLEAAVNSGGSGSILAAEYFRNGQLLAEGEAPAIQEPNSPNLTVTLRDGARLVQNGEVLVVDGDTLISGAPANSTTYLTLAHSTGEDGADIWEPTWHAEDARPAPGSGVLAKVTTDADSVTAVSTSAADTDIIPELPYLLTMILSGGTGEDGLQYWDLLKRSSADPTTIAQYIQAQINANLGVGQGATIIPPEVRDEVMVNVLHGAARDQTYHNDAFTQVPPFHAIVVSPGRGEGDWEYSDLTDEELTTMPVDETNHVFGQVA
jgi:hypothetical protein